MEQRPNSNSNKKSSRLVRDIADSLGKLPPQALDMEEAVLGAMMLQVPSLNDVIKKTNLQEGHFYLESHKRIFGAIISLVSKKAPVDMRTVVSELRESGHIEIVGGAHYIAELTSKVASAANIVYHSQIIIEHAIKREMITLASRIHQAAYDDQTDGPELLETSLKSFQSLHDNELIAPQSEQIKQTWSEIQVLAEPPEEKPLISIQGTPVSTPGNHSLLIGKKKSRKSLFVTWELGEFLKSFDGAMVFDTEQGKRHVWKYRDRVFRLTGKLIPFFSLNGRSPAERMQIIEQTLEFWPTKVRIIVIDGIRDLLTNINDEDQCSELITWLQKIILKHNIHVINVLHLNKTDNNARGHIGTELLNKAEATIELELDEKSGCTIVKCENSREKGFENFAFTHSHDDLPELTDVPISGTSISADEQKRRLTTLLTESGPVNREEFIQLIRDDFAIGVTKASYKLAEFKRNGWVIASGPVRSKDLVYKLNISDNGVPSNFKPLHEVKAKVKDPISVEPEKEALPMFPKPPKPMIEKQITPVAPKPAPPAPRPAKPIVPISSNGDYPKEWDAPSPQPTHAPSPEPTPDAPLPTTSSLPF